MKIRVVLLSLVLAGSFVDAMFLVAQDSTETKSAEKEAKWQGHVVRINKDDSMIDIHGGPAPSNGARKIAYDSSTKWTKLGKAARMDEVKAGSFIIVLGHVQKNGVLQATRIDLRLPR
jgi:hypothetical protein